MDFEEAVRKYWWIGAALLIVLYVYAKNSAQPVASAPTPTSAGTDFTSLLSQLQSQQQAQTDALANLENQNALALAQGLQSLGSALSTELQQGFAALAAPTPANTINFQISDLLGGSGATGTTTPTGGSVTFPAGNSSNQVATNGAATVPTGTTTNPAAPRSGTSAGTLLGNQTAPHG